MAGDAVTVLNYTSAIIPSIITGSGTANELAYFTASTVISSLTTATYPSLTELSYVKGVTSSIQTQLNGKQASGNYVTTDTNQTITGLKTFSTGSLILAANGTASPTIIRNTSGTTGSTGGFNTIGFNSNNNIFVDTTSSGGFIFDFNNSVSNRTYILQDASGTLAFTSQIPANPVGGTGTTNYLSKFTGSTTIGNSLIFDNGTNVLIGTTTTPTPVAGVAFPFSVTSAVATRIRIDSTQATPNSGFGLYANSVQKWSIAMFGTDSDFTIYNDALLSSAILVKGITSNVLIGYGAATADTGFKLDVNGTGRFANSTSGNILKLSTSYASGRVLNFGFSDGSVLPTAAFYIGNQTAVGVFIGDETTTNGLYVKSNGTVGIGTTTPKANLQIRGSVSSEKKYDGREDGLILYYPFSENTGTTTVDRSQTGANGTLTNGPTWASGIFGYGVTLDGSNDYISVASPDSSISLGTAMTYAMWIYPTSTTDIRYYLFDPRGDGSSGGTNSYFLFDRVNSTTVNFTTGNSGIEVISGNVTMGVNQWFHVAATRSGNTWRIYLNGVQITSGTTNTTSLTLSNSFRIGTYSSAGVGPLYYFAGTLDEARMYNRTLTANELMTLYLEGVGTSAPYTNASGNVGIGTSSPSSILNIVDTSANDTTLTIGVAGEVPVIKAGGANTDLQIEAVGSGGYLNFVTNSNPRIRIMGGGNVLIGTTTDAGYKLDVNGTTQFRNNVQINDGTTGTSPKIAFGTEDPSVQGFKGIYLESFWMYMQVHYNEGLRIRAVNGVGASQTIATFSGASGNLSILGALSKGSGSFKIDHPLPEKKDTHHLVHSFIEGPQADNIYRGKVQLVNGHAEVNIDEASGMTQGTFVVLNGNVQCFTSNESGWTAIKGRIDSNILTIESEDFNCNDTVSWMVIGERHDQHMIDTDWTDENGKVIVEPLKN